MTTYYLCDFEQVIELSLQNEGDGLKHPIWLL